MKTLIASILIIIGLAAPAMPDTDRDIRLAQYQIMRNGTSAERQCLLANAFLQKARETGRAEWYIKAGKRLAKAEYFAPNDPHVMLGLAKYHASLHNFDRVISYAGNALAQLPGSPEALGLMADVHMEQGNLVEAHRALVAMIENASLDLAGHARWSRYHSLNGNADATREQLEMALVWANENEVKDEHAAWIRAMLGDWHYFNGDLDTASDLYVEADTFFSEYPLLLIHRSEIAQARGDTKEMIRLLEKAFKISGSPETAYQLSKAHRDSGDSSKADEMLQIAEIKFQALLDQKIYAWIRPMVTMLIDQGIDTAKAVTYAELDFAMRPNEESREILRRARAAHKAVSENNHQSAASLAPEDSLRLDLVQGELADLPIK